MTRRLSRLLILYALAAPVTPPGMLFSSTGVSADAFGGGPQVTTGVVYRQGLVLREGDAQATPVYAEYDPQSGALVTVLDALDASDQTQWVSIEPRRLTRRYSSMQKKV